MKLYISTDTNTFIQEPLFPAPLQSVSFKRGDSATVELIFVSNSTSLSAISGKQITFGIKETGKYDGSYVVLAEDYTVNEYSYILKPSFNTVALNSLLNSGDGNDSNDIGSFSGMLEVTWSDNGIDWYSTNTISAIVNNDVNKGGEASPLPSKTMGEWMGENIISFDPPYTFEATATGYDSNSYVLQTTAKAPGAAGNDLFISLSTIHLSSLSAINAFVDGNGVYVSVPYKKNMYFSHDASGSTNDYALFLRYNGMAFGKPIYYGNGVKEIEIRPISDYDFQITNFTNSLTTSAYSLTAYYPDEIPLNAWTNTGAALSGTKYITAYHEKFTDIAIAINSLSAAQLSCFALSNDYMGGFLTEEYVEMSGGSDNAIASTPPFFHIHDNKFWVPANDTPTGWRPIALSAALP